MIIGSISENKDLEKRISISPEIEKKYISNNFEVILESGYGSHLGISDDLFIKSGCKVYKKENILKSSDVILQLNLPEEISTQFLKEGSILIGNFNKFLS